MSVTVCSINPSITPSIHPSFGAILDLGAAVVTHSVRNISLGPVGVGVGGSRRADIDVSCGDGWIDTQIIRWLNEVR